MSALPRCWDCEHFRGVRASEGACAAVAVVQIEDGEAWAQGNASRRIPVAIADARGSDAMCGRQARYFRARVELGDPSQLPLE